MAALTGSARVAEEYGVRESNGIEDFLNGRDHGDFLESLSGTVELDDPQLARVTRLRLLTERGYPYFDVSYVYGQLTDGTNVRINWPHDISMDRRTWKSSAVEYGRAHGINMKRLGIFDPAVISTLWG